jgi:hypothetical protein
MCVAELLGTHLSHISVLGASTTILECYIKDSSQLWDPQLSRFIPPDNIQPDSDLAGIYTNVSIDII